jgi:UrcA family protein
MKKEALHHIHLMLVAIMFASIGLAIANGPAVAQQTQGRWKPSVESVTVSAAAAKNYRVILSSTRLGEAFAVTASMPVPYSDLDLAKEPGAAELGRRIHVAAYLVCRQLDIKYPPSLYPILEGDDCEHTAAMDGMSRANQIIAAAKS